MLLPPEARKWKWKHFSKGRVRQAGCFFTNDQLQSESEGLFVSSSFQSISLAICLIVKMCTSDGLWVTPPSLLL